MKTPGTSRVTQFMLGAILLVLALVQPAWGASKPKYQVVPNTSFSGGVGTFSDDGRLLLFQVKGSGSTVWIWDVRSRRLIRTLIPKDVEPRHIPGGIAYCSKIDVVVSSDHYGQVSVWKASTGQLLRTVDTGTVFLFTPDCKRLLSNSGSGVEVWDTTRWKVIGKISGHCRFSSDVCQLVPDGSNSLATDGDNSLAAYGGEKSITSPDGKWRLSWDENGAWELWDARTDQSIGKLGSQIGQTISIFVPTAAAVLLSANFDGTSTTIHRWNLSTGRLLQSSVLDPIVLSSSSPVIAFSPDGALAVSGSGSEDKDKDKDKDGLAHEYPLTIWNLATGIPIRILRGHAAHTTAVAFSPDGSSILSAAADGSATLWNTQNGEPRWTQAPNPNNAVRCIAFAARGNRILIGPRLFDTRTGNLIRFFPDKEEYGGTNSVAFSPDGRRIITGNSGWDDDTEGNAVIWNVETGARAHILHGHRLTVSAVAFAPDGKRALTGGPDGTVRLWDATTGAELRAFRLNSVSAVTSVALSLDGARIFSGHEDGTVAIWNAGTGTLLATLIAAPDGEWAVITPEGFFDASPKGSQLVHVVSGMQVVTIDKVFDELHRPDLVREKLAGDPQGNVREVAAKLHLSKSTSSGREYEQLIGTEFEGGLTIPGWKDEGGGLMAGSVWYHYYTRDDGAYLVLIDWALPRKVGAKQMPFRVTDVLQIPPIAKDLGLMFRCEPPQTNTFEKVFAVVRFDIKRKWWRDVRNAWKIELDAGKISPVPTKGITCLNEYFGLEGGRGNYAAAKLRP